MRKELRFAVAYVANGGDAVAAYREEVNHRLSPSKARTAAQILLGDPAVQEKVAELRAKVEEGAVMTARSILARWAQMANADVTKIIDVVHRCCRYCHGERHMYQWRTEQEYRAACAEAKEKKKLPPMASGGFGYNATLPPHPGCPVCDGQGTRDVWLAPTSQLTGAERMLYEGAEVTKYGIKVHVGRPAYYLELIAKHLGMLDKKPDGAPPPNGQPVPEMPIDPLEASRIYADYLRS